MVSSRLSKIVRPLVDSDAEHRPVLNCGRKGTIAQAKNENRYHEARTASHEPRQKVALVVQLTLSVCQIEIADFSTIQRDRHCGTH